MSTSLHARFIDLNGLFSSTPERSIVSRTVPGRSMYNRNRQHKPEIPTTRIAQSSPSFANNIPTHKNTVEPNNNKKVFSRLPSNTSFSSSVLTTPEFNRYKLRYMQKL